MHERATTDRDKREGDKRGTREGTKRHNRDTTFNSNKVKKARQEIGKI